jgi:hypothetical protein
MELGVFYRPKGIVSPRVIVKPTGYLETTWELFRPIGTSTLIDDLDLFLVSLNT